MAKELPYGATSSTCSLLQPGTFSQCDQIEQYLKGFCNKLFAFKNVQPLIKTKMLPELFDESLHWECKENAYFISPNKYLVYLNEVIRFKHINFKRTSKGLIITSIKMFLYDPPNSHPGGFDWSIQCLWALASVNSMQVSNLQSHDHNK